MANGLLANAQESHTDLLWAGSGGFDTVHHDDTLTGMGTELYPLGVNSAYLNDTPWLSAAKEIAPTQTLQPGQYIQALSSLTVSGYKNHCVAVKGGGFTFPTVDQLKEWVGTDGFLTTSSFENYTAYNENNITNLYNSAGNLVNNYYYLDENKLDVSAFTSWSANLDLSGDYIPTSASGFFYPMTGNPSGFLTEHQSLEDYYKKTETSSKEEISAALKDKLDNDFSGNFYPMTGNPSGFLTEHQDLSYISGKIDDKLDTTAFENISGEFYPMTGNPSGFLTEHQDLSDYATTSIVNNISSYLSGEIDNKLDKSESANYYPMTGNPSGFLTEHQSLEDYYKKTETSSKEELSAMFATFSADDTYTLVGGYNIGISSDDNLKQTTIYFNGEPLSSYYLKTETSSKDELNEAIQYLSANAGKEYTGVAPIVVNNDQLKISANTYTVSAGSGVDFVNDSTNKRTTFKLKLSGGRNTQLVHDPQNNYIRIDTVGDEQVNQVVRQYSAAGTWLTAHQSLSNYYTKTDTSSKQQISAAFNNVNNDLQYVSANAGHIYTGISPIVVDNTTDQISADTWEFSAGNGISFVDDGLNKVTRIDVTGADFTDYYKKTETSSKQEISAALQYVSSNAGHTYTGVLPITVDNTTNEISISSNELSAGPNIDIFESAGYVVISSNKTGFPITGTDGTANYTANANFSAFSLTTGQGPAGCYVNLDAKNVRYEAYPATDVSASWYNILKKSNEGQITVSSYNFVDEPSAEFHYEDISALNHIRFIAPNYGAYEYYSAMFYDGDTYLGRLEIGSGCCKCAVKTYDFDSNKWKWYHEYPSEYGYQYSLIL